MILMIALLVGLLPLVPGIVFLLRRKAQSPAHVTERMVLGLGILDLTVALMVVGLGVTWLVAPGAVQAAGLAQEAAGDPYASIAAAIAVSIGSIGAAYAVSTTGSAAVGAIAEKPEVFGRALIFVGLAEGVAIYGLIIAFIIIGG
jgi:V/A-type H+-transporting ATPase subunit K